MCLYYNNIRFSYQQASVKILNDNEDAVYQLK